ncbi:MAG: putative iron-regulated protein [Bacillariaceae sp.]|jgi:uncharacterized iron-regulated protein
MTTSGAARTGFMEHIWHKLTGTRGPFSLFPDPLSSLNEPVSTTSNFGKISKHPSKEIARHKLVFLGEIHSMPPIISFQREIQAEMNRQSDKLHVILEHFSFDLQELLDQYMDNEIDFEQLVDKYHETGEEGHDIEPYRDLLEDAKSLGIHLHAGFLPRKYARMLMKDGEKKALKAAKKWLPEDVNLDSSDFHYNVFESLLSGRSIYNKDSSDNQEKYDSPSNQFRNNIFRAQVLKDEAMAQKITGLIQNNNNEEEKEFVNEKFLVIAGNGHLLHYCGVPERVLRENPEMATDTCLIISTDTTSDILMGKHSDDENNIEGNKIHNNNNEEKNKECNVSAFLRSRFGQEGSNPADYMYFYEIPEEIINDWEVKEANIEARYRMNK